MAPFYLCHPEILFKKKNYTTCFKFVSVRISCLMYVVVTLNVQFEIDDAVNV